jgi:hypothetical protein
MKTGQDAGVDSSTPASAYIRGINAARLRWRWNEHDSSFSSSQDGKTGKNVTEQPRGGDSFATQPPICPRADEFRVVAVLSVVFADDVVFTDDDTSCKTTTASAASPTTTKWGGRNFIVEALGERQAGTVTSA